MATSATHLAVAAAMSPQAPVVHYVPMSVEYRTSPRDPSEISLLSSRPGTTTFPSVAERRGTELTSSSGPQGKLVDLPIRNTRDAFYTLDVHVGTSPVPRRLIIDTGSSDLWVKRKVIGQPLESAHAGGSHRKAFLQYGQGEVRGLDFTDRFCVSERLCVPSQSFVLATDVEDISADGYDGLLGLGYPSLAAGTIGNTFLQNLADRNGFQDLAFGLLVGDEHQESYAMFGDAQDLEMEVERLGLGSSGAGVRVPIYGRVAHDGSSSRAQRFPHFVSFEAAGANAHLEAGFWMVKVGIEAVGEGAFRRQNMAILDSGSSLLMAPPSEYNDLLSTFIHGDPRDVCDEIDGMILCSCNAVVGNMTIMFEDPHTQRKAPFFFGPEELASSTEEAMFEGGSIEPLCRLNVQPGPSTHWILGDVFFRKAFVVHDVKGHHVTVLPRKKQWPEAEHANLIADRPAGLPTAWLAAIVGAACGMLISVAHYRSARLRTYAEDIDDGYIRFEDP
eukprot:gnl/TRDRNA2_/TRDRNA2_151353_c1_seq4.p1 gnl/TRDRNA2_/TRDRNA2_151353_c1~~gnl/TRDRNA2_/TRDRNA2_151353_c1_seq4.p1  ORF type:complete len:550 (+),score=47.45 gnl/TRDRNA2_/TRDRNA2_151353_c1_seq4:142-1650(+)